VNGHYLSGQGRKLAFCGQRSRYQAKVRFRQLRPQPRCDRASAKPGAAVEPVYLLFYDNLVRAA
jgi:hypothetical protein